MTYKEFLQELRKTPRDWKLFPRTCIRRGGYGTQCPITSLLGKSSGHWNEVAAACDINQAMTVKILNAADNTEGHDPRIRRDLLKACGLFTKREKVA